MSLVCGGVSCGRTSCTPHASMRGGDHHRGGQPMVRRVVRAVDIRIYLPTYPSRIRVGENRDERTGGSAKLFQAVVAPPHRIAGSKQRMKRSATTTGQSQSRVRTEYCRERGPFYPLQRGRNLGTAAYAREDRYTGVGITGGRYAVRTVVCALGWLVLLSSRARPMARNSWAETWAVTVSEHPVCWQLLGIARLWLQWIGYISYRVTEYSE
jgi:hypothetical protein